jgi:1-hydroxycarotenoid 3,4-desaturase
MPKPTPNIVVIGAGIGGLTATLRLAHSGARVTVLDSHDAPGGKMRTRPSVAGPVDAGPTVLTLKHVFDTLFHDVGADIADHVTLLPEPILARHFWPDGTQLDLMADPAESLRNIRDVFGGRAAQQFTAFRDQTAQLFDAFDAPMMQSQAPTLAGMTAQVLRNPALIPAMQSHRTMTRALSRRFSDPRLVQLFGRYATYVGGVPDRSPALLNLISQAEGRGVWHVVGGMHKLAQAIADLATLHGATFHYNTHVTRVETQDGRIAAVQTDAGRIKADAVLFNGDPQALHTGLLGTGVTQAAPAQTPRSLSAYVASFASTATGLPLAGHNVIFADDPATEYAPLSRDQMQTDPTLYICAQDRFGGQTPTGPERFELIMNASPTPQTTPDHKEAETCLTIITNRLRSRGLHLDPWPTVADLTMPQDFNTVFPASHGSLYGRSPQGLLAAFKRPTARTPIAGLYLAGGGAHPGAGVPMAALSGQHAGAAMLQDLHLT